MNSFTEENYLKAIYKLSNSSGDGVSTNELAEAVNTKASSVTDMLKKLAVKKLINYKKYKGVHLTESGKKAALKIIRKHRLWETFLVQKLHFGWDEVHEIAEQLEHIVSPELTNRLDRFLEFPEYDPHGDPIPDEEGNIKPLKKIVIANAEKGTVGKIVAVRDASPEFLRYLDNSELILGATVKVVDIYAFDKSQLIKVNNCKTITISEHVSNNLYIQTI